MNAQSIINELNKKVKIDWKKLRKVVDEDIKNEFNDWKLKFDCKICGRRTLTRCIITNYTGREMAGIPHSYPETEHILACIECNMSYMAQIYGMTNKEVEEWADWILNCGGGDG